MSLTSITSRLPLREKEIELDYVHDMNRNMIILPMTELESMYGNFEEFTTHGFVVIGYEDVLGDFVGVELETGQLLIVDHETYQIVEKLKQNFEGLAAIFET